MPISQKKDLSEQITANLPDHGQEIWMEAYNNALEQYKDKDERRDPNEDVETVAAKVAWSAVKNVYEKNEDGEWVKKGN